MKNTFEFSAALCATAILCASSAQADVTAVQVWENWRANLALYGDDSVTTGAVETRDGAVNVADLSITMDDGETVTTSTISSLVFTEQGDGTVAVTMDETYLVTVDIVAENTVFDVVFTQDNLAITVSGDPEAMNYAVSADSYVVSVENFRDEADVFEGDIKATIRDIAGSYQTEGAPSLSTTFDFAASGMDLIFDMKDTTTQDYAVFSGQMQVLETAGIIALPDGADINDPDSYAGNFTFESESSFDSASFVFDVSAVGNAAAGSLGMGRSTVSGAMTPADLTYAFGIADTALTIQSTDMPLPVAVSFGQISSSLNMPVAAADEAQPFGYSFALTDFVVNEEIWAVGDPTGAIPRDPATIVFDISGMAKLFFDILDPAQEDALAQAEVPGEVESLSVNTISLAAAGAEIIASGDFTFDNTDLETFDGMPRPEGELNVGITGANALIDTLVSMGLVQEQQATMGRMMMGMFTQPAGDDALTSKIEINEQGHILANGQRIQ